MKWNNYYHRSSFLSYFQTEIVIFKPDGTLISLNHSKADWNLLKSDDIVPRMCHSHIDPLFRSCQYEQKCFIHLENNISIKSLLASRNLSQMSWNPLLSITYWPQVVRSDFLIHTWCCNNSSTCLILIKKLLHSLFKNCALIFVTDNEMRFISDWGFTCDKHGWTWNSNWTCSWLLKPNGWCSKIIFGSDRF